METGSQPSPIYRRLIRFDAATRFGSRAVPRRAPHPAPALWSPLPGRRGKLPAVTGALPAAGNPRPCRRVNSRRCLPNCWDDLIGIELSQLAASNRADDAGRRYPGGIGARADVWTR